MHVSEVLLMLSTVCVGRVGRVGHGVHALQDAVPAGRPELRRQCPSPAVQQFLLASSYRFTYSTS